MAPGAQARSMKFPLTQETSELLPAADVEIQRSPNAMPGVSLTFSDLGFSVPLPDGGQKTILEPCSGHLESGQLVALMGPSGCGKSTLLDMLAMKKTAAYSGDVLINGHPREARLFRRIAAYVPQEDVMPAHWRVREAIKFNSVLKERKPMDGIVDILCEAFGLGAVADTYVGGAKVRGCSGGQKRRVTLARGVAANAFLLFCDEPTSGLSATDAELCIKALRIVAKKLNVLVLVVIHQPRVEVAQLFDTLVLLTSNPGRMAYIGSYKEAIPWLRTNGFEVPMHVNPTDFFLDRLTPGTPMDASAQLVDSFNRRRRPVIDAEVDQAKMRKGQGIEEIMLAKEEAAKRMQMGLHPLAMGNNSKMPKPTGTINKGRFAVGFCKQFSTIFQRKVTITLRNPLAVLLPVALPAMQGLIVGSMFQGIGEKDLNSQFPFVFILLTLLCLAGMQLIPILIEERTVLKYDMSEALYSELAAALASFSVDVPLALFGACLNVFIMYLFAGFSFSYLPTIFFWSILLFFVFDSFFAMVAGVAGDTQQGQAIATPVISVFMLFNGFIITRGAAPSFLRWVFWVSPNAYAFQAIIVRMAEDKGEAGQRVLETMEFKKDENLLGAVFMLVTGCIFRVLQLVALKYCHNIKK